jgi:hypothetical protein
MRRAAGEPLGEAVGRAHWRQDAERMPAGWPAAEVMRRAAGQPLGEAVGRAHWRQDAERMPAGWPAAEVMRRAAHGLADYREARASEG